ncbi:NAD(P)/FAD-dependent oxidoreductase [Paenibacillus sp. sgz500958]|uniref:NAD(P)/FAD-dependent oxidoreductase n=1 Tax=Paenibacillus sp. sgz500958 TaxID=3242475 RepID=UPI0036D33ED9
MTELTCVVIGAGYAGIHAVHEIRKAFKGDGGQRKLRLVLIDRNPYHLRKVLLFRPAAGGEEIKVPLSKLFPDGVELLQAAVTKIEPGLQRLQLEDEHGLKRELSYDLLVVAAGSTVRRPVPEQGGIALTDVPAAVAIREAWRANLKQALLVPDTEERRRLLTIAVAGAGISGIETSAEIAYYARRDALELGIRLEEVQIRLINANQRLFPEGPAKVGHKLEEKLRESGIVVMHDCKVVKEKDGVVTLSDGTTVPAGMCVWTLGLMPNPALQELGLPLSSKGYVLTDASYRVQGMKGVYSIGDCARIVDPASGRADGKTCKEALAQAGRLAKIVLADLSGVPAPAHKGYMEFFCFGLGPQRGMAWTRKWGVDFMITGKLGWKLREYTWDMASELK